MRKRLNAETVGHLVIIDKPPSSLEDEIIAKKERLIYDYNFVEEKLDK
jgi:hypothetical protein